MVRKWDHSRGCVFHLACPVSRCHSTRVSAARNSAASVNASGTPASSNKETKHVSGRALHRRGEHVQSHDHKNPLQPRTGCRNILAEKHARALRRRCPGCRPGPNPPLHSSHWCNTTSRVQDAAIWIRPRAGRPLGERHDSSVICASACRPRSLSPTTPPQAIVVVERAQQRIRPSLATPRLTSSCDTAKPRGLSSLSISNQRVGARCFDADGIRVP